jgi:uncharacterized cofD-like protein
VTRRIVAFGGGTGLSCLLRGLAALDGVDVTAVVAVSDDGGSTGRLRADLGIPAVGDARACLSALAGEPWASWFEHRFDRGDLAGHAAGNLLLAAACAREARLSGAIARLSSCIGLRGRVLPATDAPVRLVVTFADGSELVGQAGLAHAPLPILSVRLDRDDAPAHPAALAALHAADLVVLGPGSLYSSVLASLLPVRPHARWEGLRAPRLLVKNLADDPGEARRLDLAAQLDVLARHLGPGCVSDVLVDLSESPAPPAADVRLHAADVASPARALHDPGKLARAVAAIA